MDIKKFIVKVLNEAVRRNLEEMPRMTEMFTLADDWETKATNFQNTNQYNSSRGYKTLKSGLEKLQYKDFLTSTDLMTVFGYTSRQAINRAFIPDLKQAGILIPLRGDVTKKISAPEVEPNDNIFDLGDTSDFGDLTTSADKDLIFKKIKVAEPDRYNNVYIMRTKIYDQEDGTKIEKTTTYKVSVFRFLKPYVELKYSQKVNGPVELKSGQYTYNTGKNSEERDIAELFPDRKDFIEFLKKLLPTIKNRQITTIVIDSNGRKTPLVGYKQRNPNYQPDMSGQPDSTKTSLLVNR
jgi:hypothetical protein